jgi:AcrR family transcriptional regulator
LLDAAAPTFVDNGFQRTQMDDIADRLGVSKGTIYRTVDSKEALFAAVVRWGDDPGGAVGANLTGSVNLAEVAESVASRLADALRGLDLSSIVASRRRLRAAEDFGHEIERVVAELHRAMQRHRTAIMVLDRCAAELPELSAIWFGGGRYALVDLWAEYLQLRARHVTVDVDRDVLSRSIVELLITWAVKMPWDRAPRPYLEDTAGPCAVMVRRLVVGPSA